MRLANIHRRVCELLDEHKVTVLAIEDIYFGRNVGSAVAVGQARGVVLLAAGQRRMPCASYTPQQIKYAVCGSGSAQKDQVSRMVQTLLALEALPRPDHAADALAIAICHANGAPHAAAVAESVVIPEDLVVPDPRRERRSVRRGRDLPTTPTRMIALLKGEVAVRRADHVVVLAGGVGYRLAVSAETLRNVPAVGNPITLHSHLVVRDDALALYGFATEAERDLFLALIGVQSVGPKVALAVLSGGTPRELLSALASGDVARLQAVPGIGKRTAERIIVELREKVGGQRRRGRDPHHAIGQPAPPGPRRPRRARVQHRRGRRAAARRPRRHARGAHRPRPADVAVRARTGVYGAPSNPAGDGAPS